MLSYLQKLFVQDCQQNCKFLKLKKMLYVSGGEGDAMYKRNNRILYFVAILLFIPVISVCRTEAANSKLTQMASQSQIDDTQIVQWEDENMGASICEALGREAVTYGDIENVTGLHIASTYSIKLTYSDNKEKDDRAANEDAGDICALPGLQTFSTLNDLKKFPHLQELWLSECIVEDNKALGELKSLDALRLDGYAISSLDVLGELTMLKNLTVLDAEVSDLQPLKNMVNMEKLWLTNAGIKDIDSLSEMVNLEELVLYGNEIEDVSPLKSLTKLKVLKLGYNLIEDVSPLSGLTNLTELSLRDNPIKDTTPLENLTETEIQLN